MIEIIFAFLFGSIVGSFLNVCIHRMPQEGYSLIKPNSHCPNCKKPIEWYDNIPMLSYIFLGAKCRNCKAPISIRYFLVELLTAVSFVIFYNTFGLTFNLFFYLIFLCGLIVATFIDIAHRIIPDEISIGGIIVGLLLSALKGVYGCPLSFNPKPLVSSLLGVVIGGGIIYLTGCIFDLVYFKLLKHPPIQGETESMGGGDVKLLAMIGAFLGWQSAVLTFFLAPFFGAVIGVGNLITKKDHTIPYGPFLSLAAILALFWGKQLLSFILYHQF